MRAARGIVDLVIVCIVLLRVYLLDICVCIYIIHVPRAPRTFTGFLWPRVTCHSFVLVKVHDVSLGNSLNKTFCIVYCMCVCMCVFLRVYYTCMCSFWYDTLAIFLDTTFCIFFMIAFVLYMRISGCMRVLVCTCCMYVWSAELKRRQVMLQTRASLVKTRVSAGNLTLFSAIFKQYCSYSLYLYFETYYCIVQSFYFIVQLCCLITKSYYYMS